MRPQLLAAFALFALQACGESELPEIGACDFFVTELLANQDSYQRTGMSVADAPITRARLRELYYDGDENDLRDFNGELTLRTVTVEYEANSSAGRPLDGTMDCLFILQNGDRDEVSSYAVNADRIAQRSPLIGEPGQQPASPGTVPCCLPEG